jgi:hypothetical protein
MKILVLCDQGNNRSVTVAHHLKYWGHDVLAAGLKTNSQATLLMLCDWADRIIFTEGSQIAELGTIWWRPIKELSEKSQLWDIGPDIYKRPFNPELLAIVRRMMEEHKSEYKKA